MRGWVRGSGLVNKSRPRERGRCNATATANTLGAPTIAMRAGISVRSAWLIMKSCISFHSAEPGAVWRAPTCTTGWVLSQTPGLGTSATLLRGWSIRLAPTPGRSTVDTIPSASSSARGPIPERSRMAGEAIAPAERVMRRPRTTSPAPPLASSTPTARPRPDAGRFRVIVIRHRREAEGLPGIEVGLLEGNELRGLPAAHRNWPAAAVQWTALVLIVLEPAEIRQHLGPCPVGIPQARPLVVVRGHPAKRDGGVHRRRASRDLAPRELDLPALHGVGLEAPIVLNDRYPGAVTKIVRRRLDGGIVRPGLEQQDAARRIFRQPCRQHGAG